MNVRVVAATNLDLKDEIRAGRFREDLYFRLNVFPIRVPSLRERREDLPMLLNHMLRKYRERHERDVTGFTGRAIDAMLNYGWPGNIREMENIVERGVILAPDGGAIDISHLFTSGETIDAEMFGIGDDGSLTASGSLLDQAADARRGNRARHAQGEQSAAGYRRGCGTHVARRYRNRTAQKRRAASAGNLSAAARTLGITRPQLVYRLKSRGLRV